MRRIDKIENDKGQLISFEKFKKNYYEYDSQNSGKNFLTKAYNEIENKLTELNKATKQNLNEIKFFEIIKNDFKNIVTALPYELDEIINKIETARRNYLGTNYKIIYSELLEIFDYEHFRKSNHLKWFIKSLNVKSCLYCNAQFITSLNVSKRKMQKLLCQIDHFYSKSEYPYLSLTLGNLVPSCAYCNNTKGKPKDFKLTENIHPYLDDLNSLFYYEVKEDDILDFLTKKKKLSEIEIKLTLRNDISNINKTKFDNHLNTFKLKEQYEAHTDIVEELIMKTLHYNDSNRNELKNTFKDLNIDESLINRFILGNYTLDEEINLRPLSKLSKDIAKQLKLIK